MSHDFNKFVEKYKTDAFSVDLENELPQVHNILQNQKDKLFFAEFESELDEVREFAEKAVKQVKSEILNSIRNNSYKIKYSHGIPHFLIPIRLYCEYKKLLEKQTQKPTDKTQKKYIDKKTGKPFDYVLVGSLFAQGFIEKKGFTYCYKNEKFPDASKLARYIHENVLTDIKFDSIRPWVNDSVYDKSLEQDFKHPKSKSLYTRPTMNLIIEYCNDYNLTVTQDFLKIHNDLDSDD